MDQREWLVTVPQSADARGGRVETLELLAPAGSLDALYAAVAAGADAVYVGLGALNARAANVGLSLDELACGCAVAHAHGARVYVALNVYVHDAELDEAVDLARAAGDAGADACIVADAGLCLRLRDEAPELEVHLSTQAGVQSAEAAALAARELGVARVTCARELCVDELRALCATGVPIEAFCHGAICICYSGACSYSALRRGRSANRGDCTQPCRMEYELQDAAGAVLAGGAWKRDGGASGSETGNRLLCPRDYLSIRHIPSLVEAGVASFKIEGRMKNPDYVFNVVRCYRAALDAALAGEPLSDAEVDELEAQLARSFSRGFTDGYLRGGHAATGRDLMSFERAINQGLPVGTVVERGHEEVVLELTRAVAVGDTLEIRSTPGADAPSDVPKRWPMVPCPADAAVGERLLVHCKRKVELGSAVHVVRSARVLEEARAAVEQMRTEAEALCGLMAQPVQGEPARSGLRPRSVLARLDDSLAESPQFAAKVAQAKPDRAEGQLSGEATRSPALGIIDLGEVCRASDVPRARKLCEATTHAGGTVICRNLGQIALALETGVAWEAAAPLSIWNAQTARWLHSLGARRLWLPEELSEEDVQAIRDSAGHDLAQLIDVPVPGSTPLMITEHCLLTAEGPCAHTCATCERRLASQRGERFLVELDRKSGHGHLRVCVDEHGRTRIFNE